MFYVFLFLLSCVGLLVYLVKQYNEAQARAQGVKRAQSDIGIALQKRFDLINKLVDLVQSYTAHEKLTHLAVVESESVTALAQANLQADTALTQLNNIARNYPTLKADSQYLRLSDELSAIESQIQDRRERYTLQVQYYETFRRALPFALVANSLGFREAPYFEIANADALEVQAFSVDDGTILRQKLSNTGTTLLQSAREAGRTLHEHGRVLLERSPATRSGTGTTDEPMPPAAPQQ